MNRYFVMALNEKRLTGIIVSRRASVNALAHQIQRSQIFLQSFFRRSPAGLNVLSAQDPPL